LIGSTFVAYNCTEPEPSGRRYRRRSEGPSQTRPARELFPDGFHDLSTKPDFLFFVVEVLPSAAGSDD
jgi:hypothetical protein